MISSQSIPIIFVQHDLFRQWVLCEHWNFQVVLWWNGLSKKNPERHCFHFMDNIKLFCYCGCDCCWTGDLSAAKKICSRLSFVHRAKIDLLKKTDRFLRELKNLDNRRWWANVDSGILLLELELPQRNHWANTRLALQAARLANQNSK